MSALLAEEFQPGSLVEPALPPLLVLAPPIGTDRLCGDSQRAELRESQYAARVAAAEEALGRDAYREALAATGQGELPASAHPELALRMLLAEAAALMGLGELDAAQSALEQARTLSEQPGFGELERAEVLFRMGSCRLKLGHVANAAALLTVALDSCDRSGGACDRLRSEILGWRSRCHQRNRDWQAARLDVERSLELAEGVGDERVIANARFQASIVAEREGQWLVARLYAEEALELYERAGDKRNVHRVLNNLGGINFLSGSRERGVACLEESFRVALELGDEVSAAYSMSSLAQIQLRSGEYDQAELHARRALELLEGRKDHLAEAGNAQLVLGRALLEQGRFGDAESSFHAADGSFEGHASTSHRAAVWVAQGDLAARQGACEASATLYRQAAEALQDFHF